MTMNSLINNAEPAFPHDDKMHDGSHHLTFLGLTKREYFAAMAMQGILSSPEGWENSPESMARCAVADADALLAELDRAR